MDLPIIFEQLIAAKDLTEIQTQTIMHACMQGELTEIQIASFLVLMRMKGETIEELSTAAFVIKELTPKLDLGDNLIDIVGTGGDGKNTFNVSTVSSFVVAGAGVPVAKHGNRSVSSRSGSADLLTTAGFELQLTEQELKDCVNKIGICFLFAPHFHQALRHVRKARQELGIRTLFNLLGPLLNPAHVKKQVVGVFAKRWLNPVAQVIAKLGSEHALVLHSRDGLDEISIADSTDIVEYRKGKFTTWAINPRDFDCFHQSLDPIIINSPAESLALTEKVLAGETGPARDIVLLNAAAALYCHGDSLSFENALERAKKAIDSGQAAHCFHELKKLIPLKG